MFVNGFLHLMKSGIVKREVFDEPRLMRLLDAGSISSRVDEKTLQVLAAEGVVHTRLTAEDVEFLRHWGVLRAGVRFEDSAVTVDTRDPERLFRAVESLVLDDGMEVRRMQTRDESLEAVFDYLVR